MTPGLETPAELQALFAAVAGQPAIALAVSGGADSLALMLLAQRWASSLANPPVLHVYSVDLGLRPEAAGEVANVLAAAQALGLPARGLVWAGAKPASGVQEA
ncbi:MAG: ATP-binding protein, partial [Tsuneonella sp.]